MSNIKITGAVFQYPYTFTDGYLLSGNIPGLRIDFDEELATKYSYQHVYLTANRKPDGSMFNW